VIKCIERLGQSPFSLDQMYQFEGELRLTYPADHNFKPKIRRQLRVLRDKGYFEFAGGGTCRLHLAPAAAN